MIAPEARGEPAPPSLNLQRRAELSSVTSPRAPIVSARGFAPRPLQEIAARFPRPGMGPWFNALGAANDVHEKREVARAVAEWADADSIAAHYAYGNDFFCTLDAAKAETRRG